MLTQSYPVGIDGLALEVMIGLEGADTATLVAAGKPVPAPILARALIDTGSDVTCVNDRLLRRLKVPRKRRHTTQTASGPLRVDLYDVSFSIPGSSAGPGPLLVLPQLRIMELAQPLQNMDVLIGLDVLMQTVLLLDGPGRRFTISA
jgi:hypothetical protein